MKDSLIVLACVIILAILTFIGWQFVVPASVLAPSPSEEMPVACTMDARECPDGSFVGRSGPNCEFVCPSSDGSDVVANPDEPVSSDDMVACTMDARECPDGSFVGRIAPNCEFAACPNGDRPFEPLPMSEVFTCTDEQRNAEACIEIYAPVCAQVQVECVTTPCNPVPQTYPNSCFACSENRVISYTDGACGGDAVSL